MMNRGRTMKLLSILVLFVFAGCAQYGPISVAIRANGAEVADNVRDSSRFTTCNVITIGSWMREYGQSATKARAWAINCGYGTELFAPAREFIK